MALAGLKKQLNKANQLINEKIVGVEATKLDDEYLTMEKRTERMSGFVEDVQTKAKEYLQPSSSTRSKAFSKTSTTSMTHHSNSYSYQQPESVFGDCLISYGNKFSADGDESAQILSQSLMDSANALKQMANFRYALDDKVKHEFLEPLQLQSEKINGVLQTKHKVYSRRTDFDSKRNRQQKNPTGAMTTTASALQAEEVKLYAKKFSEILNQSRLEMHELLGKEAEPTAYLLSLAESIAEYHNSCAAVMKDLAETLRWRNDVAANCPKKQFVPKSLPALDFILNEDGNQYRPSSGSGKWDSHPQPQQIGSLRSSTTRPELPPPYRPSNSQQIPSCRALYDFEPGNLQEIRLREGDLIYLTRAIDSNWYEGTINGETGYFPANFVEVIVPLP